jgi:hypothetical protein
LILSEELELHLKCKTLGEVAGIQIKGKDKWLALIQNASARKRG